MLVVLTILCFNSSMVRLGERKKMKIGTIAASFQFQYGSIGSSSPPTTEPVEMKVSIPVWFDWEFDVFDSSMVFLYRFNSSMVRLGEAIVSSIDGSNFGFNSSMVRLGGVNVYGIGITHDCFNSSMVRLGDDKPSPHSTHFKGFNSSMVRLGGVSQHCFINLRNMFQFQYGSIGSGRV